MGTPGPRWCSLFGRFEDARKLLLPGGASAGGEAVDLASQNTACTAGIQRVFLLYVIFRGASNVRGVQTIVRMSGIREGVACQSSVVGTRGWNLTLFQLLELRLLEKGLSVSPLLWYIMGYSLL
jgi:hypothetical protein